MPIDLRDLVRNPETTPFSRLKYLVRQSEEDVTRFMNELFNLAALAREEDNWQPVEQVSQPLGGNPDGAPGSAHGL